MAGHVFIVHGDIMQLACDAWLLPGGPGAVPGVTWAQSVGRDPAEALSPEWGSRGHRVARWTPRKDGAPEPWLADVGGKRETPIAWYVEAAVEFLEKVKDALPQRPPRHGRAKHLVALPLVGTGQGGKFREAGAIARELLPALYDFAGSADFDLALVMIEGAAYSAAQSVRRERLAHRAWTELDDDLRDSADRLAKIAANRNLVVFIGAGVGAAAGLPLWASLLDELAREKAKMSDAEVAHLRQLGMIDRAHVIEKRLHTEGGEQGLSRAVAELLDSRSSHYAIGHALLAALPVEEVVTTNYDRLFEAASRATQRPVTVLPYERLEPNGRWLLKMHGTIDYPEDIVLTRDNFLAYRERREALAGIVQALLITRHMLFVGFSLEDDNFHQIVRAVRRAVRPRNIEDGGEGQPFGTSLVVAANPLTEELWRGSLKWIPFGAGREPRDARAAARRLEIFLDRIGAGASSATAHLFDERWNEVLTAGEREVRDLLVEMNGRVSESARNTQAWAELQRTMARLGWKS